MADLAEKDKSQLKGMSLANNGTAAAVANRKRNSEQMSNFDQQIESLKNLPIAEQFDKLQSVIGWNEQYLHQAIKYIDLSLSKLQIKYRKYPFGNLVTEMGLHSRPLLQILIDVQSVLETKENPKGAINSMIQSYKKALHKLQAASAFPLSKIWIPGESDGDGDIPSDCVDELCFTSAILGSPVETEIRLKFFNILPLQECKLFKFYCDLDVRVEPLARLLTYWTESLEILQNAKQAYPSQCTMLLLLFFLQHKKIVPTVQHLLEASKNPRPQFVSGNNVSFCTDLSVIQPNKLGILDDKSIRALSVLGLLKDWFDFFNSLDLKENAICTRFGYVAKKKDFQPENVGNLPGDLCRAYRVGMVNSKATKKFLISQTPLCIQNPFDLSLNCTRSVTPFEVARFQLACMESAQVVSNMMTSDQPDLVEFLQKTWEILDGTCQNGRKKARVDEVEILICSSSSEPSKNAAVPDPVPPSTSTISGIIVNSDKTDTNGIHATAPSTSATLQIPSPSKPTVASSSISIKLTETTSQIPPPTCFDFSKSFVPPSVPDKATVATESSTVKPTSPTKATKPADFFEDVEIEIIDIVRPPVTQDKKGDKQNAQVQNNLNKTAATKLIPAQKPVLKPNIPTGSGNLLRPTYRNLIQSNAPTPLRLSGQHSQGSQNQNQRFLVPNTTTNPQSFRFQTPFTPPSANSNNKPTVFAIRNDHVSMTRSPPKNRPRFNNTSRYQNQESEQILRNPLATSFQIQPQQERPQNFQGLISRSQGPQVGANPDFYSQLHNTQNYTNFSNSSMAMGGGGGPGAGLPMANQRQQEQMQNMTSFQSQPQQFQHSHNSQFNIRPAPLPLMATPLQTPSYSSVSSAGYEDEEQEVYHNTQESRMPPPLIATHPYPAVERYNDMPYNDQRRPAPEPMMPQQQLPQYSMQRTNLSSPSPVLNQQGPSYSYPSQQLSTPNYGQRQQQFQSNQNNNQYERRPQPLLARPTLLSHPNNSENYSNSSGYYQNQNQGLVPVMEHERRDTSSGGSDLSCVSNSANSIVIRGPPLQQQRQQQQHSNASNLRTIRILPPPLFPNHNNNRNQRGRGRGRGGNIRNTDENFQQRQKMLNQREQQRDNYYAPQQQDRPGPSQPQPLMSNNNLDRPQQMRGMESQQQQQSQRQGGQGSGDYQYSSDTFNYLRQQRPEPEQPEPQSQSGMRQMRLVPMPSRLDNQQQRFQGQGQRQQASNSGSGSSIGRGRGRGSGNGSGSGGGNWKAWKGAGAGQMPHSQQYDQGQQGPVRRDPLGPLIEKRGFVSAGFLEDEQKQSEETDDELDIVWELDPKGSSSPPPPPLGKYKVGKPFPVPGRKDVDNSNSNIYGSQFCGGGRRF